MRLSQFFHETKYTNILLFILILRTVNGRKHLDQNARAMAGRSVAIYGMVSHINADTSCLLFHFYNYFIFYIKKINSFFL